MVSTSKILTVSYGTFSCTLEGFDDSFETMKAIAEYFRDLAAEDRYFGAEPPVPDAEMLARIAEREIARRVEAREERGSIVLRAQPYGTVDAPLGQPPAVFAPAPLVQPAAVAPQPAPAAPAVAEAEIETAEDVAQVVDMPDLPAAPAVATVAPPADPDSVAAKLQRIRDVVSRTAAAPASDPFSEDEHAESFLANTASSIETALAEEDTADEPATDADGDEIAAMLSRLTGETTAEAAPPMEEVVQAPAPEPHQDTAASAPEQDAAEQDAPDDDLIEVEIAEDEAEDEAQGAPLRARVIKMKRADFEAALAAGELVPDEEDEAEDDAAHQIAAKVIEDAQSMASAAQNALRILPDSGLSPQEEEDLRRELAAVEAELVDIYRDTEGHADARANDADFDDADEDDLTSLFDEDDEQERAADAPPLVLREPREQLVKVRAEDDMSRLMAKAESAMTEPENANRRNAIAHLRAAVAATKAEQSAGTLPPREPEATAFHDDLASVVRPRRPVGEVRPATPRPPEARPAPLKLVAEQRVDLRSDGSAAPASVTPVRPRRVALAVLPDEAEAPTPPPATTPATATAEGGFAEFARTMGATQLPDVLEAAAAYLVHVEGHATFSRPQLLSKAREGSAHEVSREDGLRVFGQLLRQGKILRLEASRFTAAEDIGFKPAARRAG